MFKKFTGNERIGNSHVDTRLFPIIFMKIQKINIICSVLTFVGIFSWPYRLQGATCNNLVDHDVYNECFLCGNNKNSLMSYYGKFDSIGIVNLQTLDIADSLVRPLNEEGEETTGEGMTTSLCNYGSGSLVLYSVPGYTEISITEEDNMINYNDLKHKLCTKCLHQVQELYEEAEQCGSCKTFALIDFQTRELIGLSEETWMKDDYYVHVDNFKGDTRVTISYTPK